MKIALSQPNMDLDGTNWGPFGWANILYDEAVLTFWTWKTAELLKLETAELLKLEVRLTTFLTLVETRQRRRVCLDSEFIKDITHVVYQIWTIWYLKLVIFIWISIKFENFDKSTVEKICRKVRIEIWKLFVFEFLFWFWLRTVAKWEKEVAKFKTKCKINKTLKDRTGTEDRIWRTKKIKNWKTEFMTIWPNI